MSVDLTTSRRIRHIKCEYWHRDETVKDLSKYVYKKRPSGFIYVKPENANTLDRNKLNESFMFRQETVNLSTTDNNDIRENDIIRYMDEIWIVLNVQISFIQKNMMFQKHPSKITYIQVKK